jgi:hypothetical protein
MSSLLSLFLCIASDTRWNGRRRALSSCARWAPVVSGGHAGRQGTRDAKTERAQDDIRERRLRALEQSHNQYRGIDGAIAAAIAPISALARSAVSDGVAAHTTAILAAAPLSTAAATTSNPTVAATSTAAATTSNPTVAATATAAPAATKATRCQQAS